MNAKLKTVTYNPERKLYTVPCGDGGCTCLGYDYCFDRCYQLRVFLIDNGAPIPAGIPDDPMERYAYYQKLLDDAREIHERTGKKLLTDLHAKLIGHERERARYTDEAGKRHSFIVGKSTGWWPIHLALANVRSTGGEGLSKDLRFHNLKFERV